MRNISAQQKMWWALVALGVAFAPIPIDYAGVMVALPTIQKSLFLTHNEMHWVMNAYLLSLTCLIVLAGKLGNYFSPRNLFLSGVILFSVTSVGCAVSQDATMLLISRFLQGIAGAMIVSMQGLLLLQIFPANLLGRANGFRVMIACSFMTLSPVLGGFFSEYLSWRYLFWLNLPVTAVGFYMGWRLFPNKKPILQSATIDFLGFILSTIVLVTATIGVMQSIDWGWFSTRTVTMFAIATVCLLIFFRIEKKQADPFIDLNILRQANFRTVTFLVLFIRIISATGIFMSIFFQLAWHFSPFDAGLMMLSSVFGVVLMGPLAGTLIDYFGPRTVLTGSAVLTMVGVTGFVMTAMFHLVYLTPVFMFINAAGVSSIVSNSAILSLTYVSEAQRPIASGVSSFVRQFGTLLGMTVMSAIISHMTLHHAYSTAFLSAMCASILASLFVLFFATHLSKGAIHID